MTTPPGVSDVRCGRRHQCWTPGVVMLRGLETGRNAIVQECSNRSRRQLFACAYLYDWHAFSNTAVAQLGEGQTEDPKATVSTPGPGNA